MYRIEQGNKRNKVLILLVLCFCAFGQLYPAIVLETPQTEVKIFLADRVEERSQLSPTSLTIPLCSIAVTAKHNGEGYLQITHTPLSNGFEAVPYTLYCDNLREALPDVLSYTCNPSIPMTIPLTWISAQLSRALQGARSSYSSQVFLHLMLEI